jgi:outer membrane protein, heavy metal efflux system
MPNQSLSHVCDGFSDDGLLKDTKMKPNILIFSGIGLTLISGCAGPLDQRWDEPTYRAIQSRYTEHDKEIAGLDGQEHSYPSFGLDTLDVLSVEDAIRIAIEHSPELRSAGYSVDAASGRVLQAGLYPNPTFSFGGESLGANAGNAGETNYIFEQEIVLGGKLKKARAVAESDRLAARAEFVAQEFSVASRVSRAYYASVSANERLAKREELSALASQLLEAASSRVEAGSASLPDQLRAEVVFEQAQIELDAARFDAKAAMQSLSSAIGIEGEIELPLISSVNQLPELPSHEELLAATLDANSRISLARIAIIRAKQAHKLAQSQSTPNIVLSVGPRYSDIDSESTVDAGVSFRIPLFDRNQGEIKATLAERLSASSQLRAVQLDLLAEVSQAWSAYQSAYAAAGRYQNQLLPKAEKTLDMTRQMYQSQKTNYLRLLDAQQVVVESRIAYVNTLQRLHEAASLLNELSQTNAPWRNPRDEDQPQAEVNQ